MSAAREDRKVLHLAHSPDPDDAFMWWPLFELDGGPPHIDTGRFRFKPVMDDIESLNRDAATGRYEITAMSCARYPDVQEKYVLTACGSSMGERYGPKVVAREAMPIDALREAGRVVAVPGEMTSAFAALSLMLEPGSFRHEVVPFDEIITSVADGRFDAGVVIHEGQLTFGDANLQLVADLGQWWYEQHDLPLPLGVNAVRRDLEAMCGEGTLAELGLLLRRSVDFAMAEREASIDYARQFGRGLDLARADAFVSMYVNRWTLDFGAEGERAIRTFLDACAQTGLARPVDEMPFLPATAPAGSNGA